MIGRMRDPRYPVGPFSPPPAYTPELRRRAVVELAAAPGRLRAAVGGLSEGYLGHCYRDGGWTIAQV
jgi:hypothetical protein